MKKPLFLVLFFITLTLSTAGFVYADNATPSSTATPSGVKVTPIEKKAQDLLDRVATKVAAIVDGNKRTYHGAIKSVGSDSYQLTTSEGEKVVITNDATEFYKIKASKRSDSDFKSLKTGDDLVAIGTIDPNNGAMTASQIIAKIKRHAFIGTIQDITTDNVAQIKTLSGDTVKVDLSDASYELLNADGKITSGKLADFTKGKTLFVIAHSPDTKTSIYSSLKALVINK